MISRIMNPVRVLKAEINIVMITLIIVLNSYKTYTIQAEDIMGTNGAIM